MLVGRCIISSSSSPQGVPSPVGQQQQHKVVVAPLAVPLPPSRGYGCLLLSISWWYWCLSLGVLSPDRQTGVVVVVTGEEELYNTTIA